MSSDTVYMLATIAAVVVIVLAGGWWLNRRTGEKIGEAMRDAREARAAERRMGWGDGTETQSDCQDCG